MKKSGNPSWRGTLQVLTLCGLSALAVFGAQRQIANAELGQPSFTSPTCDNPALSPAQQLCHPAGVAVNNANGLLFVADGDNNRGLIWPSASGFTNAQAASIVLGQPNFNIGRKCTGGTTASTISDPNAAAFGANRNLWVADTDGDRVIRFSPPFTNDMPANMVIGYRDLTTSICGVDAQTLCHPRDLGFDARRRADWNDRVVTVRQGQWLREFHSLYPRLHAAHFRGGFQCVATPQRCCE